MNNLNRNYTPFRTSGQRPMGSYRAPYGYTSGSIQPTFPPNAPDYMATNHPPMPPPKPSSNGLNNSSISYGSSPYYNSQYNGNYFNRNSFGGYFNGTRAGPLMYRNYEMDNYPYMMSEEIQESSRQAFEGVESVINMIGSVADLLDSTFQAIYRSFHSMLSVVEHFSNIKSHFGQVFSALAIFRTLRWCYRKLLYLLGLCSNVDMQNEAWHSVTATGSAVPSNSTRKESWAMLLFLAIVYTGPFILWRILSSLLYKSSSNDWTKEEANCKMAYVMHDYMAELPSELSIRAGDTIKLAPKRRQRNQNWLLASNGTKTGLVPFNFVKISPSNFQPPSPSQMHPRQTHPQHIYRQPNSTFGQSGIHNENTQNYSRMNNPPSHPQTYKAPIVDGKKVVNSSQTNLVNGAEQVPTIRNTKSYMSNGESDDSAPKMQTPIEKYESKIASPTDLTSSKTNKESSDYTDSDKKHNA